MILLTGATGLVGRQVAELLLDRGTPVTALVRDVQRASWLGERGARLVAGDVADGAAWERIEGIGTLVHCAAVISKGGSWEAYAGANIRATELAAARARTLGVRMVHLSSVAVYGGTTTEPVGTVDEAFPFSPLSPKAWYARSKREAELALWREADRGLTAIALRPCVIYGPHDRLFFPGLLKLARRGVMPLFGAGDRPMALVHARSVAQAVVAALDSPDGWGAPYNVTGDGSITPAGIVAALARGLGRPILSPRLPAPLVLGAATALDQVARLLLPAGLFPGTVRTAVGYWRGGDPYRSDRIRERLGWSPRIDHAREMEQLAATK